MRVRVRKYGGNITLQTGAAALSSFNTLRDIAPIRLITGSPASLRYGLFSTPLTTSPYPLTPKNNRRA